ncbi:MAG: restriction endonuclease subunit S [Lachnospiraceae bacterium]|nr:restriction endonuclease subunit S [Lachnospiraceae bacterium]
MPKYRFEEIAINSTEKKKPTEEDKYTYLGLEHLDSGCLTVKRYGSDVAPIGEKLVMKKGDVLFGKRRAYQKKVAIAPFDGIFSAHGMVLRPREEVIDKDFFPLFISSDYFLDAAIKLSVGSLSPTINWKDLKNLELELPSIEEQRTLASVLWAMNDTKEAYKKLLIKTEELVKSQFIELFGDAEKNTKGFPVKPLSKISTYWNGLTYKPTDVVESGEGILVLRSSNIQNGSLLFEDNVYVACEIKEKLLVQENDILMCSRNGSAALVGKTALIKGITEPTTFGAFMMIIRSEYYSYLKTFFEMPAFRKQISTSTSTINQITGAMLNAVKLPVPDLALVQRFAVFLEQSDKSKFELEQSIAELDATYKKIIADYLG